MRPIGGSSLLVTFIAVGAVVFACSSEESDDWSYEGRRSECSTGPALDRDTFPQLAPNDERPSKAPECVARCGAAKMGYDHYGVVWSVAALPSGACSYDGEVCSMTAVSTLECPDGRTTACSLTGYACRCEHGSWRCYSGPQGASACICSFPDAGASDAAGD